jgi:hypothetical protein
MSEHQDVHNSKMDFGMSALPLRPWHWAAQSDYTIKSVRTRHVFKADIPAWWYSKPP